MIKSIQRGSITLSGAATATATIVAVDTANAVVWWGSMETSGNQNDIACAHLVLTNATTVTATRVSTAATACVLSYQVLEFCSGILKSVQAFTASIGAATTNVTITAVDMGKAIVSFLGFSENNAAGTLAPFMRYSLTTATNVAITVNAGGVDSQQCRGMVMEFF